MSTKIQFGNKIITEPGAVSRIQLGIKNPPQNLSFGNILIIDTGSGAGYGPNSGSNGFFYQKRKSITEFTDYATMRSKIRGGLWWKLAKPLFEPNGFGVPGVSKVYFAKAATTSPAALTYNFVGSGTNGGTVVVKAKTEGTYGNGALVGEVLASADYTILTPGAAGATTTAKVFELYSVTLGAYTTLLGDTATMVATGLAAAINLLTGTHGFVATSSGAVVTVKAYVGSGAGANIFVPSFTFTGAATGSVPSYFTGGVTDYILSKGFGALMKAGPSADAITPDKFIIEFWAGNYRGLDTLNSLPYDEVTDVNSVAEVLVTSPEFSNLADFITWAKTSASFNEWFSLSTGTVTGSGVVTNVDLTNYATYNLASGGTETYSAAKLKDILDNIKELDYTFVLCDQYGTNTVTGAAGTNNQTIKDHILNIARFQKYLFVGGGNDENEFNTATGSVGIATTYNSNRVVVVHGGIGMIKSDKTGVLSYPSIYTTANVLGRICGLAPQVPGTFKGIAVDSLTHEMSDAERVLGLDKGVLHIKYDADFQEFIINQAITSTQKNSNLVNSDGTSHDLAVERIFAQLNKLIEVNAKIELLGQPDGVNRNTLSTEVVKTWLKGFLTGQVATKSKDGLITYFQKINVEVTQDAYNISYEAEPNFPVNKLFFTGLAIDRNIPNN